MPPCCVVLRPYCELILTLIFDLQVENYVLEGSDSRSTYRRHNFKFDLFDLDNLDSVGYRWYIGVAMVTGDASSMFPAFGLDLEL